MISQIRSLYIPHIAHHPHGANLKEEELAMQIVDIVTLRPEVELCYMGLARKCYEIIENKYLGKDNRVYSSGTVDGGSTADNATSSNMFEHDWEEEDEEEDEDSEDEDDGNSEDLGDVDGHTEDNMYDDADDEEEDSEDSDDDDHGGVGGRKAPRLKLREILFYDDKVSIFKARHGHL
jgi:hypothetical protein